MWAHHLITLFGACGMLTFREGSFWTTLFGITEFTAFTHNIVWYLQKVLIDPTDAMKRVDRINKNIPPPRKTEGLLDP